MSYKDPFQTKDGGLTKKQQAFVDAGGKLSKDQSAYNSAEMSKGELSKSQKKAGKIPSNSSEFSKLG